MTAEMKIGEGAGERAGPMRMEKFRESWTPAISILPSLALCTKKVATVKESRCTRDSLEGHLTAMNDSDN